MLVPFLSIAISLLIGGIIIALSTDAASVGEGIGNAIAGFNGLAKGAFGTEKDIGETIIKTTPFIFAGLAVAVGFRGGLFNIGVEGQLFVGSICAVIAGYYVEMPSNMPSTSANLLHVTFTMAMGMLGGAAWAFIPGYLKTKTGAHEVITTIMTNYIALRIINWTIGRGGPLRAPRDPLPQTYAVKDSALLPAFEGIHLPGGRVLFEGTRIHAGVPLAIVAVFLLYWLLWRTPLGFEIRTVGLSNTAARYAGIKVERTVILTMCLSGALAGLGGAIQVLGLQGRFTTGFNVGLGFDSIAVAMLGSNHPFGVALSALLFGAMEAGAKRMQLNTQVPLDIVTIIQGLMLMFVAAPMLIRQMFRLRTTPDVEEGLSLSTGWGGGD